MRTDSRTKLLLGTAGLTAVAAMAVLGVETAQVDTAPEMSVPAAEPTMHFGETVTQSAAPSAPETSAATPPVKAQPAPTAEPG
ncbi:hypothetical protein [Mycolicibacterium lutetiense]|jgi:hypothetical protein|uniref:Alanine and proline-rich secreted protein Apa n=1 Tax=Mycolicibacterium lutetiense TaxID=1641992 RepID=A0ABS4ZP10_9MYCO|nr:hypothetical protein [Mycolicibacterium lutetiense]MBP2451235.1 hypothetical protein [Mycolicibacterium lutetiense]